MKIYLVPRTKQLRECRERERVDRVERQRQLNFQLMEMSKYDRPENFFQFLKIDLDQECQK